MTKNSLAKVNRALNRALREVNSVATYVASTSRLDRKSALNELTQALACLDKVQRMVIAKDARLEYHFEPGREPTPEMRRISRLVQKADAYTKDGKSFKAIEVLQRACKAEPPPLVYEVLVKRIKSLQKKGSNQRNT